jgi:hypothetical protein
MDVKKCQQTHGLFYYGDPQPVFLDDAFSDLLSFLIL